MNNCTISQNDWKSCTPYCIVESNRAATRLPRINYFYGTMIKQLPNDLLETLAPLRPVDNTGILIHQATDLFALWEAIENEAKCVCDPPFWGVVWPGARLIAGFILENRQIFTGKSVLDIGAGCAAAAIAALLAGAVRAVANDIDQIALSLAQLNAAANNVTLATDSRDLAAAANREHFDIIMASDMFYEESAADPLFELLHEYHAHGAEVFIADGNRPFTPRNRLSPCATETFTVDKAVEGTSERTTSLYRLTGR